MDADEFFEHFRNPYHCGRCATADLEQSVRNPMCGDEITLQLCLEPRAPHCESDQRKRLGAIKYPCLPAPHALGRRAVPPGDQRKRLGAIRCPCLPASNASGRRAVPPHANCVEGHALISEAWFEGKGCFLSQAAASVLCEHIEGQSLDGLRDFAAAEMLSLLGIPLTPRRQQCGLLAFQALKKLRDGPPPVAG